MSYKLPFFSCVIPVKGERPFFKDALASLEAQGLGEDLEIIVQDGAAGRSWSSELELESGSLNSPVEHEDDGEILFGYDGRLIYLKGYRDGSNEQRVELLKNAIEKLCRAEHKG